MTKYLRQSLANPNDELSFYKDKNGQIFVEIILNKDHYESNLNNSENDYVINLGNGWESFRS